MDMIFIQLASSLLNMPAATAELQANAPVQNIDIVNWEQFDYRPKVTFQAGWNQEGLLLHFKVDEQHILSAHTDIDAPAYQDSCVEFFYSPNGDMSYYNLEMSCTGSRLWHYKTAEGQKTSFAGEDLEKIVIKNTPMNNYRLHLFLAYMRQYACYDRCNVLKCIALNGGWWAWRVT